MTPATGAATPSTLTGTSTPALAAERARLLFGCYRMGDANDPETYTAAVAAVLAEYPPEVVRLVTDPRTGIARTLKFLPSVAEVAGACDAAAKSIWAERFLAARGFPARADEEPTSVIPGAAEGRNPESRGLHRR